MPNFVKNLSLGPKDTRINSIAVSLASYLYFRKKSGLGKKILVYIRSRCSSVVILTRLQAGGSGVRNPTRERKCSFLQEVHTGSGAYPNI